MGFQHSKIVDIDLLETRDAKTLGLIANILGTICSFAPNGEGYFYIQPAYQFAPFQAASKLIYNLSFFLSDYLTSNKKHFKQVIVDLFGTLFCLVMPSIMKS